MWCRGRELYRSLAPGAYLCQEPAEYFISCCYMTIDSEEFLYSGMVLKFSRELQLDCNLSRVNR